MSLREVSSLTIPLAIAHQVFRRLEIYRNPVHLSLLFVPTALVAAHVARSPPHHVLLTTVLNALPSYLAALATAVVVYRLFPLHPLARNPDPGKVFMIKPAAATATDHRHRMFADLHKKYGDVVRTGPNELSIADASFVEPLLGASGLPEGPTGATKPGQDRPELVHNEAAFTPFSIGPMECPGKGLATMEMRMVTVALLKDFRFRLRDGWDPPKF
ncbi:hypothetical protein C8T65DRAFT_730636 [Cerioporus squamosus]|nr:hypothetical protein C8T65DRAFT_730636 [Cerioporus squamosus]